MKTTSSSTGNSTNNGKRMMQYDSDSIGDADLLNQFIDTDQKSILARIPKTDAVSSAAVAG